MEAIKMNVLEIILLTLAIIFSFIITRLIFLGWIYKEGTGHMHWFTAEWYHGMNHADVIKKKFKSDKINYKFYRIIIRRDYRDYDKFAHVEYHVEYWQNPEVIRNFILSIKILLGQKNIDEKDFDFEKFVERAKSKRTLFYLKRYLINCPNPKYYPRVFDKSIFANEILQPPKYDAVHLGNNIFRITPLESWDYMWDYFGGHWDDEYFFFYKKIQVGSRIIEILTIDFYPSMYIEKFRFKNGERNKNIPKCGGYDNARPEYSVNYIVF